MASDFVHKSERPDVIEISRPLWVRECGGCKYEQVSITEAFVGAVHCCVRTVDGMLRTYIVQWPADIHRPMASGKGRHDG